MAQNEEAVAVQKRKYLDLLDDEVMVHPSGANPVFKRHSHTQPLAHLLLPSPTKLRANECFVAPTVPPTHSFTRLTHFPPRRTQEETSMTEWPR
jgi:hypothetical protein